MVDKESILEEGGAPRENSYMSWRSRVVYQSWI